MPCSTPKKMKLFGYIRYEPALTNAAQPATWAQRRQKRAQGWLRCSATACPSPAQNRNRLSITVRCSVHTGSLWKSCNR